MKVYLHTFLFFFSWLSAVFGALDYVNSCDELGICGISMTKDTAQGKGTIGASDPSKLTDDVLSSGISVGSQLIFGATTTLGMTPEASHLRITEIEFVFTGGCEAINWGPVELTYVPFGKTKAKTIEVQTADQDTKQHITAILPDGEIETAGPLELSVDMAMCEPAEKITEIIIEATEVLVDQPTDSPNPTASPVDSPSPTASPADPADPVDTPNPTASPADKPETASPTTPQPTRSPVDRLQPSPTMSPTKGKCKGDIVWGDPHMLNWEQPKEQWSPQIEGEFYYQYPCDPNLVNDWPYFVTVYQRMWVKAPKTSAISQFRLILNTKPVKWVIAMGRFVPNLLQIEQIGTDDTLTAESPEIVDIQENGPGKDKKRPRCLEYLNDVSKPDGEVVQGGKLCYYFEGEEVRLDIEYYRFDGQPRLCAGGEGRDSDCGENICGVKTIGDTRARDDSAQSFKTKGFFLWSSCPVCQRNLLCGALGRYFGGDCGEKRSMDKRDRCYSQWRTHDGLCFEPPKKDSRYTDFVRSWEKKFVDGNVATAKAQQCTHDSSSSPHYHPRKEQPKKVHAEQRSFDLEKLHGRFPGVCANDVLQQQAMNKTCYENTVGRYPDCCREIGICDMLHQGCVYDLCACVEGDTLEECVKLMISDAMNTTCNVKELYPTSTPTAAPTPSPVSFVSALGQDGSKAQDLVIIMVVFFVLFLCIALCAFAFYRHKTSKGKAYVPDDEEDVDVNVSGDGDGINTYTHS